MDWENLAVLTIVLAAVIGLVWRTLARRRRRLTHKACADCTACSSGSCAACEIQPPLIKRKGDTKGT